MGSSYLFSDSLIPTRTLKGDSMQPGVRLYVFHGFIGLNLVAFPVNLKASAVSQYIGSITISFLKLISQRL